MNLVLVSLVAGLALNILACGKARHWTSAKTVEVEADDVGPIELTAPTYSKTIAKLAQRHCTSCHQEGGIAPFALTSLDSSVRALSGPIVNALVERTMPPPSVDNSGACQKFSNSTWLTEAEINAFKQWVDAGMPAGSSRPDLKPPEIKKLAGTTVAMRMAQAYTPQPPPGEIDDYRCFILDPQQTSDTLITAIQVLPDKVPEVHHVIIFRPSNAEAQAAAEAKVGADGRPGYPCFGAAGVPSAIVGLWAPGGQAEEIRDPENGQLIGLPLEKGRKLIMQVHYNTQNGALADRSGIVMKTSQNAIRAKWMVMANFLLSLKPGVARIEDSDIQGNSWWQTIGIVFERGLADEYIAGGGLLSALSLELVKLVLNPPEARDFKVYGVAPHMHILGRSIKLEKLSADQTQCLASVPQFDFHWQAGYNYVQPLTIAKTDRLRLTCQFNTTGRTDTVHFGEGTSDEMCLAFLLVAE